MTRINARIDGELARRLLLVRERTGLSTSDILKASLDAYFQTLQPPAGAAELLGDFVGSAQGPSDLSSSYKDTLTLSLERKAAR